MKLSTLAACLTFSMPLAMASNLMAADQPQPIVTGLTFPESVCHGPNGHLYVTEIGVPGTPGDGKVSVIIDGKAQPFAKGFDDPKGITAHGETLYFTDVKKVIKLDAKGNSTVFAEGDAFPIAAVYLNDIEIDPTGKTLLVVDSGNRKGQGKVLFKIDVETGKATVVTNSEKLPGLTFPNGVTFDGPEHCILAEMDEGKLYRVKLSDGAAEQIAEGVPGVDGLVFDSKDRLFITSWKTGKAFVISKRGEQPKLIGEGLQAAADCCLSKDEQHLLIPDMKSGTLTKLAVPQ